MKIKKQNNKVAVLALSSLLVIGAVAGTIAMFNADFEVGNEFKVGKPNAKVVEEFEAPKTDIVYGGDFKKATSVHNLGEGDIYAKMNVTAEWTDPEDNSNKFDGILNPLAAEADWEYAATLKFGDTADITGFKPKNIAAHSKNDTNAPWRYDAKKDGFIYYGTEGATEQVAIPKGESSSKFLESVGFSDNEDVDTEGKYYMERDWNATKQEPKANAQEFTSTLAAAAEIKKTPDVNFPDEKVFYYQLSELKYPNYKGQLDVKITSVIQSEPFTDPK